MRYSVEITGPAERNIGEAHDWIHAESHAAAARWIDGLLASILGSNATRQNQVRCRIPGRNATALWLRLKIDTLLHVTHTG